MRRPLLRRPSSLRKAVQRSSSAAFSRSSARSRSIWRRRKSFSCPGTLRLGASSCPLIGCWPWMSTCLQPGCDLSEYVVLPRSSTHLYMSAHASAGTNARMKRSRVTAALYHPAGRRGGRVAAVRRASRFDEQHVNLFLGERAMLDALRHHEQLARPQLDGATAQADLEAPLEHQEKIVGVGVRVPAELALNFHDHDVVAVELRHGPRLPVLGERRQLLGQNDLVHRQI